MPYVNIASNVAKTSVNTSAAITAITKALSTVLERPAPHVMVQMELDLPMSYQESEAPTAFVHVRSIGRIDDERNPKTAAALTATVAEHLKVPAGRVYLYLEDVSAKNWGANGNIVG
ncbi:hypothetical protein BBJ28_00016090 [Nothophytophthora sp. Chile5]|nr:hypothetical protein BBJ28_00016090 [Nothophytophthora sp. Chile5]